MNAEPARPRVDEVLDGILASVAPAERERVRASIWAIAADYALSSAADASTRPGVRRGRTGGARKRVKERPEYVGFVRRSITALARRVVDDADPAGLGEMAQFSAFLDDQIGFAAREMRARWGLSWADIGRGLGVTRQTAFERWSGRTPGGGDGE